MAVNLSPVGGVAAQFFDNDGNVLSGGKIYTYIAGTSTSTQTYTTSAGNIPHTNPIILDSAGRVPTGEIWLTDSILYKFVLRDSGDALIATYDNIAGINSNFVAYTNEQQIITATAGQTVFALTITYLPGTNNLSVFVDGVNQYGPGAQYAYTETDANTVTFNTGLHVGAEVKFTTTQQQGMGLVTDLQYAGGARDALCYANSTSVRVFRDYATMGGFRFRGQYTKGLVPTFAMPANKVADTSTDLGGMTAVTYENWYAVFACANDGDAEATLQIMPFLRAQSVAGSTISLSEFKEGMTSLVPQTYAWTATNNLANCDLLVIKENGEFSGRVTKITANTTGSITVSSLGSIVATDTFLPAPPGFQHYVYLCTFYVDTAEVRNIYDSGTLVKSKGIYTAYPNTSTGSYPTPIYVDCTGYISPLATAVVLDSSCSFSTASVGDYAEYFAGDDSGHTVQTGYVYKATTNTMTVVFDNIQVPFLYPQQFAYSNAGALVALRSGGQFNVTGWFEP